MAGTETALATRDAATSITRRAGGGFDAQQWALIQAFLPGDCQPHEAAAFMELCARYELDPFAKQVWAVKMQGKVQTIVSRDGLLAIANRHDDFRGCESDVVHEHDYFRKSRHPEHGTVVEHEYRDAEGNPTAHEDKRGAIIGAWALVHREGMRPTYFFAYYSEYKGRNVWDSHPHAMMQKVPETMTLRKAYSISGVMGETEVDAPPAATLSQSSGETGGDEIQWPEDAALTERLTAGFRALGYRRAKVRTLVNGCSSQEDFEALLVQLNEEADAGGVTIDPPEGEPVDAEPVLDAEPVADAA